MPSNPMSDDLPERGASWSIGRATPEQAVIDRAVGATLPHPNAQAAMKCFWHLATVMLEPKSFLARSRLPEIEQALAALNDCAEVLLVSYQTSTTRPEPLSGHGQTFDFVLHPNTYEILAATTGTWRS